MKMCDEMIILKILHLNKTANKLLACIYLCIVKLETVYPTRNLVGIPSILAMSPGVRQRTCHVTSIM